MTSNPDLLELTDTQTERPTDRQTDRQTEHNTTIATFK